MSLSRHLRNRESGVRAWFEERFPRTRGVATQANRALRAASSGCPLPAPRGSDAALVGTAIDFLVRAHLAENALDRTVATTGAVHLSARGSGHAMRLERQAVAAVRELRPWDTELGDPDWSALCEACAVLARFEQCYRDIGVAIGLLLLLGREAPSDHSALVPYVAGPVTLDDLASLGRVAIADHRHLRNAAQLEINPTFERSHALGGADADVIFDGLLLDWKAGATTKIVGRRELWQLLGYVFADTDDEHSIRRIGISAVRWRRHVSWSVEELSALLAGDQQQRSLDELRAQFAVVVLASPVTPAATD